MLNEADAHCCRRRFPNTPDARLVWVGRLWVAFMTAVGIAWIPIISRVNNSLYLAMQVCTQPVPASVCRPPLSHRHEFIVSYFLIPATQDINSYFAPPIAVVFILGVLWPRGTGTACFVTLLAGHIPGILRLILTVALEEGSDHPAYDWFVNTNFLHFAAAIGTSSHHNTLLQPPAPSSHIWPLPPRVPINKCTPYPRIAVR